VRGASVMTYDGFWLPAGLRERVLDGAAWDTIWLRGGALVDGATPGAVAVRAPHLSPEKWEELLAGLSGARSVTPRAQDSVTRWQTALEAASERIMTRGSAVLPALSAATGYSMPMLAAALGHGDLVSPGRLAEALRYRPTWSVATRWEPIPGLTGRVRFFPARRLDRAVAGLHGGRPLARPAPPVELVLGYAAGNVPGTALLIALLAGSAVFAHPDGATIPAILVRNSRHEPLFAPWVLSALEEVDPELVASTAAMIWGYDEAALQGRLMRGADLLIAAAGDEAIAALDALRARHAPGCRFHRHGHKVSFAVIAQPTPEAARLAALDSSLWDQNGCLSARVHFVEGDAVNYAASLTEQMRVLAGELSRGTTPRRFVHRAFDAYAALESAGQDVSVCSTYDDDFAVVMDGRPWDRGAFLRAVNACTGRTVIVRQVTSVLDVPRTLAWLPAANLQSASVAMTAAQALEFADAAGSCGVTAVRSLGRAAFPLLAYSWDGLLPLDLGCLRPEGHFTTVEFDDPTSEMALSLERWKAGAALPHHNAPLPGSREREQGVSHAHQALLR
jgi:hypothetical protein